MLLMRLNDWSSYGRSFIYILVLIALMAIAYYVTRFLSVKARGYAGGNVKIIEGVSVGQGGSVVLLKAGKKFVLVGVTKDRVSFLTELDETDIDIKETPQSGRFDMYLGKFLKGKKNER